MENLFVRTDVCTKFVIEYCPRQRCDLRTYCSNRTTIALRCHTNWPIQIKMKNFLYNKKCTCEGYYSFGAIEVKFFSFWKSACLFHCSLNNRNTLRSKVVGCLLRLPPTVRKLSTTKCTLVNIVVRLWIFFCFCICILFSFLVHINNSNCNSTPHRRQAVFISRQRR